MEQEFLLKQRKRIQTRIDAIKKVIREGRSDAGFKGRHILPVLNIALARTFSGAYGDCIDCGNLIPRKRLEHTPGVIRCLACQEQEEK